MTLEELKDVLSTYGVNDDERNAPVVVMVYGTPIPVVNAMVDNASLPLWNESTHKWEDGYVVRLQVGP